MQNKSLNNCFFKISKISVNYQFILIVIFCILFSFSFSKADSLSLNNLNLNGAVLQNEENIDSLYTIINETIKDLENEESKIKSLKDLAKNYEFKNIQSTVLIYRKALEIAEKSKKNELIINSMIDLSFFEITGKNYQKALNLLNNAKKIAKTINDYKINAKIYNYLGLLSYHTQNYENAIEFYNQAIDTRIYNDDSVDIDLYISNIGLVNKKSGNLTKAIQDFTISSQISKSQNNKLREAENYKFLAETYFQQNSFVQSLKFYNMAKEMFLELKNDEKTANIMIDLGYVLFKYADYYKSIAHLKKGIELANNINNNTLKKQGYNYLHKVYYKTGDFRKAYEALMKYAEINENISLNDLNKTISEMQIKLDFDKKTTLQKNQDDNDNLVYILISVIIILILGFIYLFFLLQKNKKIHEKLYIMED